MGTQVAELADRVEGEAGVEEERVGESGGGWGARCIDPGGDVGASEEPVVGAVFEDVPEGHGCRGEFVDEYCFVFAFEEVQDD